MIEIALVHHNPKNIFKSSGFHLVMGGPHGRITIGWKGKELSHVWNLLKYSPAGLKERVLGGLS